MAANRAVGEIFRYKFRRVSCWGLVVFDISNSPADFIACGWRLCSFPWQSKSKCCRHSDVGVSSGYFYRFLGIVRSDRKTVQPNWMADCRNHEKKTEKNAALQNRI